MGTKSFPQTINLPLFWRGSSSVLAGGLYLASASAGSTTLVPGIRRSDKGGTRVPVLEERGLRTRDGA